MALLWPVVYYFYGLYQVRRHHTRVEEGLAILVATALATLLLTGVATFSRGFTYSRLVLVLFFGLDVFFVFAGRTAIRRYLEEAWRHGVGVRHVLVVGAGRLGRAVVEKLVEHPEAGLRAAGLVDDDPRKLGQSIEGVPVIGTTAEASRIVEERGIDTVFLALPLEAHRTMLVGPEGGREDGRRRARRAGPPAAHHVSRRRRGSRRVARRPPDADAADRLDEPRQAQPRRRDLARRPRLLLSPLRNHRPRDSARGRRARLLPPDAHGPGRPPVRDPEVSLHARRRRGRNGSGLGGRGGPAPHADRTAPAPHEPRRATAARQRAARRDVARRAAARAPRVRAGVQGDDTRNTWCATGSAPG